MQNTILCVKWGDKYGNEYVEKLKEQVENNCSVKNFNFYCLTDKPTQSYDIQLPTTWDAYENGKFWAYRKLYMFDERICGIKGEQFLYLDLDVIIQQDLKYFLSLIWKDLILLRVGGMILKFAKKLCKISIPNDKFFCHTMEHHTDAKGI